MLINRQRLKFIYDPFSRFHAHDNWAIASHIAFSCLTSIFPFLIFLFSLSRFIKEDSLAQHAGNVLIHSMPKELLKPIIREIKRISEEPASGLMTVSALASLYFSSSCIESMRLGLNRAYIIMDYRPWWVRRIESIVYVICIAAITLCLTYVSIITSTYWEHLKTTFDPFYKIQPFQYFFLSILSNYWVLMLIIFFMLVFAHKVLAAGKRKLVEVLPGIFVTMTLWFLATVFFKLYLLNFNEYYIVTYGGLASAMAFMVMSYWFSAIFILGGEINESLIQRKKHSNRY